MGLLLVGVASAAGTKKEAGGPPSYGIVCGQSGWVPVTCVPCLVGGTPVGCEAPLVGVLPASGSGDDRLREIIGQ